MIKYFTCCVLLCFATALFGQVPTLAAPSAAVLQEGQTATVGCTANCTSLTWKVNGITGGNSTVGTITAVGSTATYTAPSSIIANNNWGGCPASFNDAVWNVPISALPLISNWNGDPFLNDAWFQFYSSLQDGHKGYVSNALTMVDVHHLTIANNSSPTINFNSSFSGAIANMPYPPSPTHFQESGVYDFNFGSDHHTSTVNTDTCEWWEVYNRHIAGSDAPTHACAAPVSGNCYGSSSFSHQAAPTSQSAYSWVGGTGAGGDMLTPYILHLSEVKSGTIKHALYLRPPRDILRDCIGGNCKAGDRMWPATFATGFCTLREIVGLSGFPTGSGYSAATTISFSGGGGSGTVWTPIITGGVITGATMTHGVVNEWTSTPTVVITDPGGGTGASLTATIDYPCMPYGSRIALDSTWLAQHSGSCTGGTPCITGDGLTVATALATYGGIALDNCCNSTNWQMDADFDLDQDTQAANSIRSMMSHMLFSRFHIYDQSKLAVSTADNINRSGTSYGGVVPDNDLGYIPPGAVWITATNGSGTSKSTQLALRPPAIGTPDAEIPILAGDYSGSKGTSGGYQIPYWVTGITNTAVTWSCATCAANGSFITAGGVYTPPTTLSAAPNTFGGGVQDIAVCTLSADPNVTATVYFNVLPNSGNYTANTIRIDSGNNNVGGYGPDGNGHYWLSRVGTYTAQPNIVNESWGNYKATNGGSEQTVYNTEVASFGPGDNIYKLIVPNGQYKVRIMSGWDEEGGPMISNSAANHNPLLIGGEDNGYGGIKLLHWPMMLHTAKGPYAIMSNSDATFGELVTNNVLWASVMSDYLDTPDSPNPLNWLGWRNCKNTCLNQPIMSGLDVEPDTSTPHWAIGVTNWANSSSTPANFLAISDLPVIQVGQKLLLYIQDWYTGIYDPVFSIVTGPGSIAPTTVSLELNQAMPAAIYTAPSTTPYGNQHVTIMAQSQSNPSISATIQVQLDAGTTTPVFFK